MEAFDRKSMKKTTLNSRHKLIPEHDSEWNIIWSRRFVCIEKFSHVPTVSSAFSNCHSRLTEQIPDEIGAFFRNLRFFRRHFLLFFPLSVDSFRCGRGIRVALTNIIQCTMFQLIIPIKTTKQTDRSVSCTDGEHSAMRHCEFKWDFSVWTIEWIGDAEWNSQGGDKPEWLWP